MARTRHGHPGQFPPSKAGQSPEAERPGDQDVPEQERLRKRKHSGGDAPGHLFEVAEQTLAGCGRAEQSGSGRRRWRRKLRFVIGAAPSLRGKARSWMAQWRRRAAPRSRCPGRPGQKRGLSGSGVPGHAANGGASGSKAQRRPARCPVAPARPGLCAPGPTWCGSRSAASKAARSTSARLGRLHTSKPASTGRAAGDSHPSTTAGSKPAGKPAVAARQSMPPATTKRPARVDVALQRPWT